VTVNINGQIHEQLRNRPPGTPVDRVTVDDSSQPKKRPFGQRRNA